MGLMTGDEFKRRRVALRLSQAGLAERMELHERTISKWERGVNPIPEWAALALTGLERQPRRRSVPTTSSAET
jgi:DNA-binding transcriptional regulator YiaG